MAPTNTTTNEPQNNIEGFLATFFTSNYSFEVQDICRDVGIDIASACKIKFRDNGTVQQYGEITPGNFKADADIAGLGVWWGLSPGLLVCALAVLFLVREAFRPFQKRRDPRPNGVQAKVLNRRERIKQINQAGRLPDYIPKSIILYSYYILKSLIIAAADGQTIYALAYAISFGMESKCTLSAYHYSIGLITITCSCITITLPVLIVRDYWSNILAAFLRTLLACAIFAVTGRFLWYEKDQTARPERHGWGVSWSKHKGNNTDSTIFLPIACFLDPDLDPTKNLTKSQENRLGADSPSVSFEFVFFWSFLVLFVLVHLSHMTTGKKYTHIRKGFIACLYGISLSYCIVIYALAWSTFNEIRKFVHNSGWIQGGNSIGNPEHAIRGIGQILPVIAVFSWLIFTGLGSWQTRHQADKEYEEKSKKQGTK